MPRLSSPDYVVNVVVQTSPYRLFLHSPSFKTRIFDVEQLFYAVRNSHFDGAYRQYLGYFPGSADTEDTREHVLVNLARGLFMTDCGGNA